MLRLTRFTAVISLGTLVFAFYCKGGLRIASSEPVLPDSLEFCSTRAAVVPWDSNANEAADTTTSNHFFVNLWTSATTAIEARVLLFSDTESYSVELPSADVTALESYPAVHYTAPVEIVFDRPVNLRYNYVAAARSDGREKTDCPTYVEGVGSYSAHPKEPHPHFDEDTPPSQATIPRLLRAFHGASLRATPVSRLTYDCGSIYKGPHLVNRGAIVGDYGSVERFTLLRVYIAASGEVLGTRVAISSGLDRLDQAAVVLARAATFEPASFLCAPVVSTYDLRLDYELGGVPITYRPIEWSLPPKRR